MVGLSLSLVLPLLLHLASPAPAPAEDAKEVAQVHSPALGEVVQVLLQLDFFFFSNNARTGVIGLSLLQTGMDSGCT